MSTHTEEQYQALLAALELEKRKHADTAVELMRYSRMYADQLARANEMEKRLAEVSREYFKDRTGMSIADAIAAMKEKP